MTALDWRLIFSIITGFIGSSSYVTVINFKLIGKNNTERKILLKPFLKDNEWSLRDKEEIHFGKLFWYCIIGGFIAAIFQYPESTFVSIQSFLIGVTWPTLITHHASGRMKDLTESEIDELGKSQVAKTDESQAKDEIKNIRKLFKKK